MAKSYELREKEMAKSYEPREEDVNGGEGMASIRQREDLTSKVAELQDALSQANEALDRCAVVSCKLRSTSVHA